MSQDQKRRVAYRRGILQQSENKKLSDDLENFDWFVRYTSPATYKTTKMVVADTDDHKTVKTQKFIDQLYTSCMVCGICDIGNRSIGVNEIYRDPHLLSSRNIGRFVIVNSKPSWEDLSYRDNGHKKGLVSQLIADHGLDTQTYITYLRKCGGKEEDELYYDNCSPFLDLEIRIINPRIIIAIGQKAYQRLVGSNVEDYGKCMLKPVVSKYGHKLIGISDTPNMINDHLLVICKLMVRIQEKDDIYS